MSQVDQNQVTPSILGLSGSLRAGSYNTLLLRAAVQLAPAQVQLETASIAAVPLFNGDIEAAGAPPAVRALVTLLLDADGLLLVTPEYNHSLPGVLKNAIDWLSRPPRELARRFGGLPIGVIGASAGAGGTALAQASWLPVLRALGALPYWGGHVLVSQAGAAFDASGTLVDAAVREQLTAYMQGFATFVARNRRRVTRIEGAA